MLLPAAMLVGLAYWFRRDRASDFDSDYRKLLDAVSWLTRPRR